MQQFSFPLFSPIRKQAYFFFRNQLAQAGVDCLEELIGGTGYGWFLLQCAGKINCGVERLPAHLLRHVLGEALLPSTRLALTLTD